MVGTPVSVLRGHTAAISYLDFSPVLPNVLLSCSSDGTCRIWNASNASVPAIVLKATGPQFALSSHELSRSDGLYLGLTCWVQSRGLVAAPNNGRHLQLRWKF
jgi:WD40 repeat protein